MRERVEACFECHLCMRFIGPILDLHWTYIGPILDLYWTYIGPTLDPHWTCIGPTLDLHWTYIGPILDVYRTCLSGADSDCPPSHQANRAQACWQLMSALVQDLGSKDTQLAKAFVGHGHVPKDPKDFSSIKAHPSKLSNAMWSTMVN